MRDFDDRPIETPDGDLFGYAPFAETIAKAIAGAERPVGSVIAINGPWGAGKSSLVNLVKHHLGSMEGKDDLKIVDFKCWWFRGEEVLTLQFFRQLYAAMDGVGANKARKAISKMGSRFLRSTSAFGGAFANIVVPGAGGIVKEGASLIGELIEEKETVESLHAVLSDALRDSEKRYLIIIDDIDRLAPDEALLIFRLVKSVGQLPNVTYLLAYDRAIAEKIVSERYPSEGPHYLEKIVQASFDLPMLSREQLTNLLKENLHKLWNDQHPIGHF